MYLHLGPYIILHDIIVLFVKEAPVCCQLEGIINTRTYIHTRCTKLQQRLAICKIRIISMKASQLCVEVKW